MTYFDPKDEPVNNPIPEGWYHAVIKEAQPHLGKNETTGEMVKICVVIDDPEFPQYAGREIYDYLCINHSGDNPMTRNIARKSLTKIIAASGLSVLDDPSELNGTSLMVRLTIKPPQNGYEAGNDVKGWKGSGQPTPQPRAQQPKAHQTTSQRADEAAKEERAPSVKDRSWGNE